MAHSLRWEKVPEYAETLIDGAILEGLAIVLEEKVLADLGISKKQFFLEEIQKSCPEQTEKIFSALSDGLSATTYDYNTIFYTGNDVLPRWAGYKLGYHFVRKYLEQIGRSVIEATFDSYKDLVKSQNA